MIPALFRGSLWLAALAAGLAVVAPEGQPELLAAISATASVSAALLWRAARAQPLPLPPSAHSVTAPLAIDRAALHDAEAQIRQLEADAASFEAALHDAARILKGELGARTAVVYRVRAASEHLGEQVIESIATPHGFHAAVPIAVAAGSCLGRALRERHAFVALPEGLAMPVVCGDAVVALIELRNIEIDIEAEALGQLLTAGGNSLGRIALHAEGRAPTVRAAAEPDGEHAAARQVLLVVDNPADAQGAALGEAGWALRIACGRQQGLQALRETQFDAVLVDFGHAHAASDIAAWATWRRAARESLVARGAQAVPLIVVQPEMQDADESQFRQLGFDGLLRKPLRTEVLNTMLIRTPHPPTAPPDRGSSPPGAGGSVPPHTAAPVTMLDADALARLAELDPTGASRLLPRVLTAYLNSVARLHPQLLAARPGLDLEAIRHVTHTLKSSSASIGAVKLAAICAEIDAMIRTADTADLQACLDSMDAELARVLKAVKQLLGGSP